MHTPIKRISSSQKIKRIWDDISDWLKKQKAHRLLEDLKQGASKKELKALELKINCRLPQAYRAALTICNRTAFFGHYQYLSTDQVYECWKTLCEASKQGLFKDCATQWNDQVIQDTWWDEKWIPFALDVSGNLLCLDLNPGKKGKKGQIIFWEQENNQGPFGYKGSNFNTWLGHIRDQVIAGELSIDTDAEKTERFNAKSKKAKGKKLNLELSRQLECFILDDNLQDLEFLLDSEDICPDSFLTCDLSLLRLAAEKRKLNIVKMLVERGANVNIGEERGLRTPLFESLWGIHQNEELIQYLLSQEAHINISTTYDGTPLHAAVLWGTQAVISLLLEKGANIDAQDSKGRTPLDLAKRIGKSIVIDNSKKFA